MFESRPRVFPSRTIMLESGEIKGFPMVGDYASYCRCVGSQKLSNGKKKRRVDIKGEEKELLLRATTAWLGLDALHALLNRQCFAF